MKIARLRAEFPMWTWTAVRNGMAWEYVGDRGSRTVRVHAVARLVDEDTFATEWRVDDGYRAMPFAMFRIAESEE